MKLVNETAEANDFFHTLAQAVLKGQEQPRKYNGEQTRMMLPYTARFKMKIWYRDGNCRTYFSFDQIKLTNGYRTDELEGLKKLIRLGHVHHKQEVKTLVIWACGNEVPLTSSATYDYEIFKVTQRGEEKRDNIGFRLIKDTNSIIYKWEHLIGKHKKLG